MSRLPRTRKLEDPPVKTSPTISAFRGEVSCRKVPSRGARILIVDDDELLRELVAEALTMDGYQVVCAEDGEAAWDSLCKLEIDLMITDHEMPRLSGFDLLSRMQGSLSQVRTIMVTGYVPFQYLESVNLFPFCDLMPKPFSLNELLQKVDNSLKLREA